MHAPVNAAKRIRQRSPSSSAKVSPFPRKRYSMLRPASSADSFPWTPSQRVSPRRGPALPSDGGASFAEAILTTDTHKKEAAVRVKLAGGAIVIGGCAKGSGMIEPNMATMLAFITTDAKIAAGPAHAAVRRAVDRTFNLLSVNGDTSTNDMALALANGVSGVKVTSGGQGGLRRRAPCGVRPALQGDRGGRRRRDETGRGRGAGRGKRGRCQTRGKGHCKLRSHQMRAFRQ